VKDFLRKIFKSSLGPLKALASIAATAVVTSWLSGQPLKGLTKLEGLYKTFIQASVPAWRFALAFLVALLGVYYFLTHLPIWKSRGTVHFIPDAHNSGWSQQTRQEMNVRIGGTFTYEGPASTIQVVKAYLAGTQPTTDMLAQMEATDGTRAMIQMRDVWLTSNRAIRYLIDLKLKPVMGKPGQPLKCKLILLDTLRREFPVGSIELPYTRPPV
jgi:hypothetical protein